MKQVIFAYDGANGDSNNVENSIFGMGAWVGIGSHVPYRVPVLVAGTFQNWKIQRKTAVAVGTSVTYTLRKNGVNTALAVTITAGNTEGENTSDTVSFSVGDTVSVFCTFSGAAGTSLLASCIEFENSTDADSVYGSATKLGGAASDLNYNSVFNGTDDWHTSASPTEQVVPIPGTLVEYKAIVESAPGGANSVTYTIYLNGVKQDGSGGTVDTRLTISGAATSGTASFSLAVSPGDLLYVENDYTGAISLGVAIGYRFTADDDGYFIVSGATDGLPTTAVTRYVVPQFWHGSSFLSTEATAQQNSGVNNVRLFNMYVRLTAAPGGSTSRTIRTRKNGADGNLNVTLTTGTTGNDTTNQDNVAGTDLWDVAFVSVSTPAASNGTVSFGAIVVAAAAAERSWVFVGTDAVMDSGTYAS